MSRCLKGCPSTAAPLFAWPTSRRGSQKATRRPDSRFRASSTENHSPPPLFWDETAEEVPLLTAEDTASVKLDETPRRRRGRKKGEPLDEEHRLAIKEGLKGKNKYERTALHRYRVGRAVKRRWQERRDAGLGVAPKRCSICGETGHNKQTCPAAEDKDRTRHRKPRSFEHRWKIAEAGKRAHARKKKNNTQPSTLKLRKCSYCHETGHNRRTCPHRKKAASQPPPEKSAPESVAPSESLVEGDSIRPLKVSEVDDLESLYTVPVEVGSMWRLALDCALRAYRSGVNRQRMEFTFPLLTASVMKDPLLSSTGDARQFRVASLFVEAVLKGIKSHSSLEGRLDVNILDEEEGTVYWEGKEINALLFPQPHTLDVMISRAMMQRKRAPRLQLLVNPQWQPGQIVSDFGFGQLRALRERFVESFEEVFYIKQISVFGDTVILMRCYPSQWQVHLVQATGDFALVGSTREKPAFEQILAMLENTEGTLSGLNWIEQFRTKYIERRKRVSPFPLRLTRAELEQCFGDVESSLAERLTGAKSSKAVLRTDIVTGETVETVRDIKLDPVKQFASLLGVKE